MEFNTNYTLSKAFLSQYFHKKLRPSIELWINEDGQKLFTWDDLVKNLPKAEANAKIQNN